MSGKMSGKRSGKMSGKMSAWSAEGWGSLPISPGRPGVSTLTG